jgi:hypothetical protein
MCAPDARNGTGAGADGASADILPGVQAKASSDHRGRDITLEHDPDVAEVGEMAGVRPEPGRDPVRADWTWADDPEECDRMTAGVRKLIETARPAPPTYPFDWEQVERRLGAPVPQDYRELLDTGGGGLWLDYVRLYVPAPGPGLKHVDLERSALEFEQLQDLFEDDVVVPPDDLAPDSRLLPWASTGTGATLYWQVFPGAAADAYPIRISDRNGEVWERHDLLTTDFLLGLVQGEVRSALLDESWMKRDVLFTPYVGGEVQGG